MEEVIYFDVGRFCRYYVSHSRDYRASTGQFLEEYSTQMLRGGILKIKTVSEPPRVTKKDGPVLVKRVFVEGGYADLFSAFVGWVGEQGLRSVLEWWDIRPTVVANYEDVPIISTSYVTECHTHHNTYYNVIPLVKDKYTDRVLYSFSRDEDSAANYNMRFDWLTREPLTREEQLAMIQKRFEKRASNYYFDYDNKS